MSFAILLMVTACQPELDPGKDRVGEPTISPATPTTNSTPSRQRHVEEASRHIKHVVFIIKENRTFDHMFGSFPGADGTSFGFTCDGRRIPLTHAADDAPGPDHSFTAGLTAINGGRMNCFDELSGGADLQSYVQYREPDIPNYWAYARQFVLADRFFSSTYGPTGIEHLFTVAAQTDRFIDHERRNMDGQFGDNGIPREYCEDPSERAVRSNASPDPNSAKPSSERSGTNKGSSRRSSRSDGRAPTCRCCLTSSRRPGSHGSTTSVRTTT